MFRLFNCSLFLLVKPLLDLLGGGPHASKSSSTSTNDTKDSAQIKKGVSVPRNNREELMKSSNGNQELATEIKDGSEGITRIMDRIDKIGNSYEELRQSHEENLELLRDTFDGYKRLWGKYKEMSNKRKQEKLLMKDMNERIGKLLEQEQRTRFLFKICTFLAILLMVLIIMKLFQ